MGVEIEIIYESNLHCKAIHGPSKQSLNTEAPVDNGGKGEFFSPTDLVATALGTCMLTIMGIVAKRNSLDLEGAKLQMVKEMTSDPVRRIGALKATITMPKDKVFSASDRAKLEQAAKTCPVRQSLHPDTRLEVTFVYP